MDRGFIGLDIAVLAVSATPLADDASARLVIEKLEAAGHRVVAREHVDDAATSVTEIATLYRRWIADAHVDVVIVVSGARSEAASEALAPLATRPLAGFTDLFRFLSFEEIGTAAMLVDAAAAQCESTFVFVLPASVGAVRTGLDKLLLPQLDYRTKPHNLVMRMPRHHHAGDASDAADAAPVAKTPWIVARAPGEQQQQPTPPKSRPKTEPGIAASPSVSQRIAVAVIARPEPVSVSQRMSEILEAAAPPPPARPKVATAKENVPLKPPAQIVPLAQLLTNKPVATVPPPVPIAALEELPATELKDIAPAQIVDDDTAEVTDRLTDHAVDAADDAVTGRSRAARIDDATPTPTLAITVAREAEAAPPAPIASAPETSTEATTDDAPAELPVPIALSTKVPTGPIVIDDPHTREAILAAQKRAVTERVAPLRDVPRSVAVPAPRKRDRSRAMIWSVIAVAAASLVVLFFIARERQRDRDRRTELVRAQREAETRVADLSATPTPDDDHEPVAAPALTVDPEPSAEPDASADPGEIDMSADPANTPPPNTDPTPSTNTSRNPRVAANPSRPPATPQPRTTKPAVAEKPVDKPADKPADEPVPAVEPGCDEVSCVLDRYQLSCCAKFKPAEPATPPVRSGLPEKLEKPMVTAGIAKVKPAVIACGEKAGVTGMVKISVTVSPAGAVTDASVAASPDAALGECVATAVRRAMFDKTETGGSFTYPFVF